MGAKVNAAVGGASATKLATHQVRPSLPLVPATPEIGRDDLAFDTSFTKAARDDNAIQPFKLLPIIALFQIPRVNPLNIYLSVMGNAGVVE
jgi:hypothetical protein